MGQARTRPCNTSIRGLLKDERCAEAVLKLLRSTRVGMVMSREGALDKRSLCRVQYIGLFPPFSRLWRTPMDLRDLRSFYFSPALT